MTRTKTDARLPAWVDAVDYYWQRTGIAEADRVRMRAELTQDLDQSLKDGACIDELIAVDPAQFALDVAAADGTKLKSLGPDPEITDAGLVSTVLAGAVAGGVLALLTVYPLGFSAMDKLSTNYENEGWFALFLHVVAAAISVATAMGALWWRFRFRGRVRRTLVLTGGLFTVGGLASIAPTMALARSLDYSNASSAVLLEVAIVVGCCSVGVLAARRLLTRQHHPTPGI